MGVRLHLSEVKGPVTDKLQRTDFLDHLSGEVFLSQHDAIATLTSVPTTGDALVVSTDRVRVAGDVAEGSAPGR
jgi:SulP family sulfate permease